MEILLVEDLSMQKRLLKKIVKIQKSKDCKKRLLLHFA